MKIQDALDLLFVDGNNVPVCEKCRELLGSRWRYLNFTSKMHRIHLDCIGQLTDEDRELVPIYYCQRFVPFCHGQQNDPFYYGQRNDHRSFELDAESARARATSELEHLEDGETIIIERHDVPRFVAESIKKLTEDNA